jgi:pimeloyl-ACP methyl ester carboxylesterase
LALDSLHIEHAAFVGHSIVDEELTRLAATDPRRVDKLVYLDAAYDRVRAQENISDSCRLRQTSVPRRPRHRPTLRRAKLTWPSRTARVA